MLCNSHTYSDCHQLFCATSNCEQSFANPTLGLERQNSRVQNFLIFNISLQEIRSTRAREGPGLGEAGGVGVRRAGLRGRGSALGLCSSSLGADSES